MNRTSNVVLQTAAAELTQSLRNVSGVAFHVSAGEGPAEGYRFDLIHDASLPERTVRLHALADRCEIRGQSPNEVLAGVYAYLERLGFCFTVRGPVPPDAVVQALPVFTGEVQAQVARRGIRQHINFPMDISSYPLAEAQEYIRNLARMRMNTMTFHLYEACGWYHQTLAGKSMLSDPTVSVPTAFYSEKHRVPSHPAALAHIRNRHCFCRPEMEAIYGTEASRANAYYFLQMLLREAKRYGMYVIISLETFGSDLAELFADDRPKEQNLWVDATFDALDQATQLYGEADEWELISRENCLSPCDDIETAGLFWLRQLCPAWSEEKMRANIVREAEGADRKYLNCLEAVTVALETWRRVAQHPELGPRLAGKQRAVGLYSTDPRTMQSLTRVLNEAVPEDMMIAWLPAHGAQNIELHLPFMEWSPAEMQRLRLYSWIEVDGSMYAQQYEPTYIGRNLAHPCHAVLFHHWRNAENELGLLFAAQHALRGVSPDDFARQTVAPLWGIDDAEAVAHVLQRLEALWLMIGYRDRWAGGFCYFPCWWHCDQEKTMEWIGYGPTESPDKAIARAESVLADVRAVLPSARRLAGVERLRFLAACLEATIANMRCNGHMHDMRQYLLSIDRTAMTPAQREEYTRLGHLALADAEHWMDIMAQQVADRGVEGNLTSFEHVVIRYIRRFIARYGTEPFVDDDAYGLDECLQAPPLED